MFEISKIEFADAFICELNKDANGPIVSNYNVDKDDIITINFIEDTIYNLYNSDSMKWGDFLIGEDESNAYKNILKIADNLSEFKSASMNIINDYFKLVKDNVKVNSGNIICVLFFMDNIPYFGFFKYNHKEMLTRHIEKVNNTNNIYISKDTSLFATSRHKADEGFVVNLTTTDVAFVDKIYLINSDKINILKDNILILKSNFSKKEKLDIFNKVTKNLEEKYIKNDIDKKVEIKKAISDSLVTNDNNKTKVATVSDILENAFESEEDLKKIYKKAFEDIGIEKIEKIEIPERIIKNKYKIQKVTTDLGIEIKIPVDCYGDKEKVEFISNADGSFSIIIKNIKTIIS